MTTETFPSNNLTWQILAAAQKEGYAVGAYNCYNNDGVMAVIRAAERKRSPAIIQVFPWTLHFQGRHFIDYIVAAAHAASVPIAVHLDHCIKESDVELALTLPFDSIMVDASTSDPDRNIKVCADYAARATQRGITVEAELGRIEGGEDGLAMVDMETLLTEPSDAAAFSQKTGVHFLAPSFGNVHGPYPEGGAEKFWQLDRLETIGKATGLPLVLHGTHPVSDGLFRKAISRGVVKINLNRAVRDEYTKFVASHAGSLELTELKEESVEIYARSIERMMDEVLGSSGRA
ncbi:hypothetical protein JX265_004492 [Neoarthrinium moseri]|uniref:Fructose-bisphosphate aldolase n=1 Tax=Neoarthrinium moseri TaxID=1658444 RepID=A0A9P9WR45_9PEZI|nr:hypothetical protein JX265_004492 [Neoarthrinium moseri]